jgi:hypothetical protein
VVTKLVGVGNGGTRLELLVVELGNTDVGFGPGTRVFVVIVKAVEGDGLDDQLPEVIIGLPGLKVIVIPSVVRTTDPV